VNKKREAREFCFQYFYHLQLPVFEDLKANHITGNGASLNASVEEFKATTNTMLSGDLNTFVVNQIKGTLEQYDFLEETIQKYLKNWKIARLSKVDHTMLLLAVHELCFDSSTPTTIVINEAIEISKKFGTAESSSFINGVLDNVAKNEKKS